MIQIFFWGGLVEILDDFSEDTKPLGISECVSLLMSSSRDEFLKSSGSCTGYLWGTLDRHFIRLAS